MYGYWNNSSVKRLAVELIRSITSSLPQDDCELNHSVWRLWGGFAHVVNNIKSDKCTQVRLGE